MLSDQVHLSRGRQAEREDSEWTCAGRLDGKAKPGRLTQRRAQLVHGAARKPVWLAGSDGWTER